ncbi:MAG: XdhC family protein [Ardenticatenales bacterium]|nr:XdhC family protein [Ardenticatenales bacterium]
MFDEFFTRAHELLEKGIPFATALVVRAENPTSGKPGDKAIVTADGVMHGWIGGSCAQPTVIEESLKALADGEPRLIRLSTEPAGPLRDGLIELPMTCFSGGTLEIYIEPHRPLPRLLIVGSLPVARSLARLGQVMNYRVVLADPEGAGAGAETLADVILTDLAELADHIDPLTYVIVASHGNYDEIALETTLRSPAAYVGLVASQKRAESVREYLLSAGVSEAEIGRLKAPAGLDIQARRGDEIALSIMAEIVQRRRLTEQLDGTWLASLTGRQAPAQTTAIDPVCGMTVVIETAQYKSEYQGEMVYFCAAGCKQRFAAEPERYVVKAPAGGISIDLSDMMLG